jgi:hypothetical protein
MTEDRFEQYFAEKLWEMIPAIYRHEDGLAENPGVLRALVEVMAQQAARLRRSHDRLWEDQFIELCSDWVVPYIGDLVGTRLVSALNTRARRVDVAKTIYYRRRKGTPAVLEELISDITGWEGKLVEGFRRLARARHGLDPDPAYYLGRFTATPSGGLADLRAVQAAEMSHSAFDEFHHTPDLRKPRGNDGLYGIQRLLFYLYRLHAFELDGITPQAVEGTGGLGFTFDPSGRDIPLYMPRNRPQDPLSGAANADWGKWRQSFEWELPAPIRCRLLNHAEYLVEDPDIIELVEDGVLSQSLADELRQLSDIDYKTEQRLHQAISQLPSGAVLLDGSHYPAILAATIIEQCGKQALYPNALTVYENASAITKEQIAAGDLSVMQTAAVGKRVQIDPQRGRLMFIGNAPESVTVSYHYGFSAETGAGSYDRSDVDQYTPDKTHSGGGEIAAANLLNDGVTRIEDSATYGPVGSKASVQNLVFIAANNQRPYLRLESDWTLDSGANEDSTLVLDGLWIGAQSAASITVRGDFESITLRHVTVDPGGPRTLDETGGDIPPVSLVVEGNIELLTIESCILGPLRIANEGYIEKAVIKDSIVQSRDGAVPALQLPDADLHLQQVTILGTVEAQCLWATDTLISGRATIENTQCGCFRFSAAHNNTSRLPRPYRSVWIDKPNLLFTSTRFGDPGYLQLSEVAPVDIVRGAENGAEMGVYNALINPIKLDSLRAKVEEYMPFGLLPVYIFET